MHYDWKNESFFDGLEFELIWWDEALLNELFNTFNAILSIFWTIIWLGLNIYKQERSYNYA